MPIKALLDRQDPCRDSRKAGRGYRDTLPGADIQQFFTNYARFCSTGNTCQQ